MTLNGHFTLNSVLRRYVWSSEASLVFGASILLNLYSECRRTSNRDEQLQHRAVSLRQHGFLVSFRSCLESTQSDYVEFRDVETLLLDGSGGHQQRQRRLCSTPTRGRPRYAVLVMSSSFTMSFHSNNVYDGTGFTANYQFHRGLSPSVLRCVQ